MTIIKESAPHLRRKASVTRMMVDVLIALAPTLIFSFVVYPLNTLFVYLISLAVMIGSEFLACGIRNKFQYKKPGVFGINNVLTAAISAVIYTLIMPAGAPLYAVAIGALAGIVLGKLVFGGLGSNIFNPAAVGMLFAKLCFGSQYGQVNTWYYTIPDAAAGATPLAIVNGGAFANINTYPILDLFLGRIPGTLGEVYAITILVGLAYLLIRRSADYRIVVSFFGTFTLLSLVAGLSVMALGVELNILKYVAFSLLTGGVLFGGTFMLTDPVTSPINAPSRWMYGMIAAVFTIFIRLFAALPEGMGFSILIANMIAVVLDHYEWSSSRYTWKKFLAMGLLVVVPALVIFLVIKFGGVYHG